MTLLDSARTRLRLLFARRAAESRMRNEFQFHIEMETDALMHAHGLARDEARRRALAAFGGVETHAETMRDGRGLAWLSGLSLDLKLGARMLVKYPMLTIAGGLALAVAIGIGAGWYDLMGKVLAPTIPLPQGERLVAIETQNILTNEPEARVAHDLLDWRRDLRTIQEIGAWRGARRNLLVGRAAPDAIQVAEITAAAFRAAQVPPILGRGLLDADERPGAPPVVVLGYDVWQRAFSGRPDALGTTVQLGNATATVIGVMPEDFAYPVNHHAWTPLSLRASYAPLEGGALSIIGRLAPGVTHAQADAELRVIGERASAALPATHAHLRPRVLPPGLLIDDLGQLAMTNLPVLLVLLIACTTVGTLIYARTATREGEIALRSALGASRARIVGQLFVEALVLATVAAAVGLFAADRLLTWGIESVDRSSGDVPFWITPGLTVSTMVYAAGLTIVCAGLLSVLPALRATRAGVQTHLANRGSGGATLRFGRVWTGAMLVQVALTAIGIPVAMQGALEATRKLHVRAAFPMQDIVAAQLDLEPRFEEETPAASEARQTKLIAALERRLTEEPGVMAVTFADRVPGGLGGRRRVARVEPAAGGSTGAAGTAYEDDLIASVLAPGFLAALDLPIVAGRGFEARDGDPRARAIVVNEAFARAFSRQASGGSPIGGRLRYASSGSNSSSSSSSGSGSTSSSANGEASVEPWYEIVGIVRDLGVDPDDVGEEQPFVFHAATPGAAGIGGMTMSPLRLHVRVQDGPAAQAIAARLPAIVAGVDAALSVRGAQPVDAWIRDRHEGLALQTAALAGVTLLVLCLSALGIFSLVSVSVSRRTREIGLRAALGAHPRHVLAGILSRAIVLMGGGAAAGGGLLLTAVAFGAGPSTPASDVPLFAGYLGMTSLIMLAACLLACIGPARRALRINPIDALRDI